MTLNTVENENEDANAKEKNNINFYPELNGGMWSDRNEAAAEGMDVFQLRESETYTMNENSEKNDSYADFLRSKTWGIVVTLPPILALPPQFESNARWNLVLLSEFNKILMKLIFSASLSPNLFLSGLFVTVEVESNAHILEISLIQSWVKCLIESSEVIHPYEIAKEKL